ncbi:hypothetical protein OF001_U30139 [Pseudomonas sp. OF001]|nr:hypothetical protein OF001_U30139 [Pseudomonas sp. OF001]
MAGQRHRPVPPALRRGDRRCGGAPGRLPGHRVGADPQHPFPGRPRRAHPRLLPAGLPQPPAAPHPRGLAGHLAQQPYPGGHRHPGQLPVRAERGGARADPRRAGHRRHRRGVLPAGGDERPAELLRRPGRRGEVPPQPGGDDGELQALHRLRQDRRAADQPVPDRKAGRRLSHTPAEQTQPGVRHWRAPGLFFGMRSVLKSMACKADMFCTELAQLRC